MQPRISLITLGVADVAAARAFYERLGFRASSASQDAVSFFQLGGGIALGLFGRAALAEDAGVANTPPGFSGVTLAHNVRSEEEVDETLAEAVAAGGRLVKAGEKVFWGGYSGYFADPDGHLWEVAHNPFFALEPETGALTLPV
ncbi:MAG: VOC family protein [Hyphomonadaceae bacterium]